MKRSLLLFISLLGAWFLQAQTDSTALVTDSVYTPTTSQEVTPDEPQRFLQLSLNLDYGKLIGQLPQFDEKYEAGASLLFFNQLLLTGEYGYGALTPESALINGSYSSEGTYFRLGGGYLRQISAQSKLGLSVLYASGQFSDRSTVITTSPSGVQPDFVETYQCNCGQQTARWYELVLNSESRLILSKENPESKINELFGLGFYLRARFLTSYDRYALSPVDVYAIPGYGRTVNKPNLALNLFLKIYLL